MECLGYVFMISTFVCVTPPWRICLREPMRICFLLVHVGPSKERHPGWKGGMQIGSRWSTSSTRPISKPIPAQESLGPLQFGEIHWSTETWSRYDKIYCQTHKLYSLERIQGQRRIEHPWKIMELLFHLKPRMRAVDHPVQSKICSLVFGFVWVLCLACLLYTSPSPRDA